MFLLENYVHLEKCALSGDQKPQLPIAMSLLSPTLWLCKGLANVADEVKVLVAVMSDSLQPPGL